LPIPIYFRQVCWVRGIKIINDGWIFSCVCAVSSATWICTIWWSCIYSWIRCIARRIICRIVILLIVSYIMAKNIQANHIEKVYRKLFQRKHCKHKCKGLWDFIFKSLNRCHAIIQSKRDLRQIHSFQCWAWYSFRCLVSMIN